jgi:hypothetical protein
MQDMAERETITNTDETSPNKTENASANWSDIAYNALWGAAFGVGAPVAKGFAKGVANGVADGVSDLESRREAGEAIAEAVLLTGFGGIGATVQSGKAAASIGAAGMRALETVPPPEKPGAIDAAIDAALPMMEAATKLPLRRLMPGKINAVKQSFHGIQDMVEASINIWPRTTLPDMELPKGPFSFDKLIQGQGAHTPAGPLPEMRLDNVPRKPEKK